MYAIFFLYKSHRKENPQQSYFLKQIIKKKVVLTYIFFCFIFINGQYRVIFRSNILYRILQRLHTLSVLNLEIVFN